MRKKERNYIKRSKRNNIVSEWLVELVSLVKNKDIVVRVEKVKEIILLVIVNS